MRTVSVIMPCFNHEDFLKDSVDAVLRQTYAELELIVIDDYSSDNSWDLLQALSRGDARIKTIRHERNCGASKSRNDGLRAAIGEYVAFCDADDIWEKEKLTRQVQLLQRNLSYDVAYCDALIIDQSGAPTGNRFSDCFPLPKNPSGLLFNELIDRNFINIQSVLLRRECIEQSGYFDESIKWVEDWWYWIRLSRKHQFLYSREALTRYRIHSRSTNLVQQRGYSVNRFKVFRRILRKFDDLSKLLRAKVLLEMGINLRDLGKYRVGDRLLCNAAKLAVTDPLSFAIFIRAMRRLIVSRT